MRAAGFIVSRSRQRYVSSRKKEILFTTAAPVRNFSLASVTCSNVFVDTPTESRIKQVMARKGLVEEAAKKYLEDLDRIRARRTWELFKIDWRDPTRYDLVLNTAKTTVETAAQLIAEVSQREEYRPTAESLQAMKDLTITARVGGHAHRLPYGNF